MNLRNNIITGSILFVVSGIAIYAWYKPEAPLASHSPRLTSPRSGALPRVDKEPAPVIAEKSGPIQKPALTSAATPPGAYILGARIDPADPIDFSAMRQDVLLDIERGRALQSPYDDFWKKLDRDTFMKWTSEMYKMPEFKECFVEGVRIRSEYNQTNDVTVKRRLIESMRVNTAKMAKVTEVIIARAKTEDQTIDAPRTTADPQSADKPAQSIQFK